MILSHSPKTILVVDDCKQLCEFIELVLYNVGYHVLTADTGANALRLARNTSKIDLLVSDLEMPHMRGEVLANEFACLHPAAQILFISGTARPSNTTQPFEFLAKPFTIAELRTAVRRTLQSAPVFLEASRAA